MTRLKFAIVLLISLLLLSGAALFILGVFAYQLGIDNNQTWGRGRIVITLAGILLLKAATGLIFRHKLRWAMQIVCQSSFCQRGRNTWQDGVRWVQRSDILRMTQRLLNRLAATPFVRYFSAKPARQDNLFAWAGTLLTLLVYLWYITNGTLTTWTPYSQYFDRLADAFLAGQLSLLEQPNEQLLAVENPYYWLNREGIPLIWDTTLYQGKYYYYWGPVPALLAAAYKTIHPIPIDDQYLVFFFCGGLAVVLSLVLALIRRTIFPTAPSWTIFPLTLLGGLAVPVLWLVNRPNVYETAIAGGQFFLMLGLYAALRSIFTQGRHEGWLLLAGLAWGAAVNCRLNLAAGVVFLTALTAWVIYRKSAGPCQWVGSLAWLALPLALWAFGLGWYNTVRFGSPFETGHRYQLTGPALPLEYHHVISTRYIIPSMYSYLARPLLYDSGSFPFVFAPFLREQMWPFFIRLPEHYYYPEAVAGIFQSIPAFWLIFLPFTGILRRLWLWLQEHPAERSATPTILWGILYGGVLSLFFPLLVFISTSMRYLADVTPILALTSAAGLWWGMEQLRQRSHSRQILLFGSMLVIVASIGISLMVNLASGDQRLEANNPELYSALLDFFTLTH